MSEPIKIVVTAETAEAAAKLEAFMSGTGSGLKGLASGAASAGGELKTLRETAMATHEGFRSLESGVLLLGGTRFPELSMGIMGVTEAMRGLRSMALLTGASLATVALPLAAVAAVVAGGMFAWSEYSGAEAKAAEESKKLEESLAKIPAILERINNLQKAGRLGPDAAAEYTAGLNGKRKLYRQSDGQLTATPTESYSVDDYSGSYGGGGLSVPMKSGSHQVTKDLPQATPSEVQAWTEKQLGGQGGLDDAQVQAVAKLSDLVKKANDEELDGLENVKAGIREKFALQRDEIQKQIAIAGTALTDKQSQAAQTALAENRLAEIKALDAAQQKADAEAQKRQEEMARKQTEAVAQAEAEKRKLVEAQDKEMNNALEAYANATSEKTKGYWDQVYSAKYSNAKSELDRELITQDEFDKKVSDAQKEHLAGYKEANAELEKTTRLKDEIARAEMESQLHAIQGSPFMTDSEKAQQSVPVYQGLLNQNEASVGQLTTQYNASTDESAQLQIKKQINELMVQQVDLQNKLNAAQGQGSFSYNLGQAVTHLQNMNNLAKEVAATFENVFNAAVSSISRGITGLIEGTMTWKQALQSIYNSIINEIISGIVQMGVRWVLTQTMMAIMGPEIMGAAIASMGPLAAAASAIWAAPAVLSATATFGASAAAAPEEIVAAQMVTIAGAGFATGGLISGPGTGTSDSIPARLSAGEFVVNADAVNAVGANYLHSINAGNFRHYAAGGSVGSLGGSPGGSGGSGGGGSPVKNNISMYAFTDMRQMTDHLERNTDHEKWVVDVLSRNIHKFS